ncbi:MAG: glycosyltransferase [Pyrinomonadaceae bacterium]
MARIGIAIPSYLGASFIGRTLQSIVGQTYEDWLCVVVNDGEEDGTAEIVAQFDDSRVRYVCDGKRRGQFANFNRAILEVLKSDAEIIRLLCADDVLYPYNLEDVVRVFAAHPGVGLVASHYDGIDEYDRLTFRVNMEGRDDLVMTGWDYLLKGVSVGNTIGGPSSVALRREAIETAGLFDTRVNHSGESDLWHRVASDWDVAWIGRRAGLKYRFHESSITGRGKYSVAKFTDPVRLVRRVAATESLFGLRWWAHQYTIGRLHSINLQLLLAMARKGHWSGVRAGLSGAMRDGLIVYSPFWLPRVPWQVLRLAFGLDPSRRLFWRKTHESLQPPRTSVKSTGEAGKLEVPAAVASEAKAEVGKR